MNKLFSDDAWNDYLYWQQNDKKKLIRINKLIKSIERDGYSNGIGKPELFKYNLSSYWSRRINDEHRIVYKIVGNEIYIASCRVHY